MGLFRKIIQNLTRAIDGQTKNPDVLRFRRAAAATWVMVILTFMVTNYVWRNEADVVFAVSTFPTMSNCDDINQETRDGLPPFIRIFESRTKAKADCDYHLALFTAYQGLQRAMFQPDVKHIPQWHTLVKRLLATDSQSSSFVPNLQSATLSVELVIKGLLILMALAGSIIFAAWRGTAKSEASKLLYKKPLYKVISSVLLAVSLIFLTYLTIDIAWFIFERVIPLPIIYTRGTAIIFSVVLVGVLTFFVIHWVSEISITQLSIFASIVLMLGLVIGMLVTNHVWHTGVTNAYSVMSEAAYSERLAFEVAGDLGSRRIFRLTFIAAGILLVVYAVQLTLLVTLLKAEPQQYNLAPKTRDLLRPGWILGIGSLGGILTMFVGLFPTDGTCIWYFGCELLNLDVSSKFHLFGAFVGPLFLLFMVMTYWYIAHPIKSAYVYRLRDWSWIGITLSSIAIIMHLIGYRATKTNLMMGWGMAGGYVLVLAVMLFLAAHLRQGVTVPSNEESKPAPLSALAKLVTAIRRHTKGVWQFLNKPIPQFVLIVLVGLALGLRFPLVMTTVTLEFVVLALFSLFIYAYSLYTVEYIDDALHNPCTAPVQAATGNLRPMLTAL